MTKKDYIAIAKAAAVIEPGALREKLTDELGKVFIDDNPKYNHTLFADAVETEREKRDIEWEKEWMQNHRKIS